MFKKLRQIGQAMSPDAIRQGLEASRASLSSTGSGGQLTPEQLAALPPETRAAYEQAMGQAQQSADAAIERDLARRALLGPAGDHLYGPVLDREQLLTFDPRAQMGYAAQRVADALRETVRGPAPAPTPAPVSGDPAEQAAHERAGRDEARTPYLSPTRRPVHLTRIATDPKRSIEELAAWLGSSGLAGRPDLVYGVARVPDHVPGGGMLGGLGTPAHVEWEVAHAAEEQLPPVAPAAWATFDARETWAARRAGEPSVLDEDLGVDHLRQAGLGPEHSLGVARRVEVDVRTSGADDGGSSHVVVGVTGVHVLHPSGLAAGVGDRMAAGRPLQVVPQPGVAVAVLNWDAIRRVVAPRTDKRPLVPSPFPHLPSSAGELLVSYLSIVGIDPRDCYSAQATVDQPHDVIGGGRHVTTSTGEEEPAADGRLRQRFRGASRVVVVHRDTPEYAAGRERWAAYEREVLQSRLWVGTAVRAPVEAVDPVERGVVGGVLKGLDAVQGFWGGDGSLFSTVPHQRYCHPPAR